MDNLQPSISSHKNILTIIFVAGIVLLVVGGIVWYTVSRRTSEISGIAPIDSDNDMLSDSEEIALGTDVNKEDTDGDSLSDYLEVQLKTDPKNSHSLNPEQLDKEVVITRQLEQEQQERNMRINKLKLKK